MGWGPRAQDLYDAPPFVPVWGDKMYMIRIRLCGIGGGGLLDVDIQGKMQGNWKKSA